MANTKLFDRAGMTVSGTPGTGTITLSAAATGYQTFAAAGVATGNIVSYLIEDGANWEFGTGTYTSSGTTLSRDTVSASSAGGTTKISVTSSANVYITARAGDLVSLDSDGNANVSGKLGVGFALDGTARVQIGGGTTSYCPLELEAGTLMTSPDGGSMEYDGNAFYLTPVGNQRGTVASEQFCCSTSTRTLTSTTALQKIFNTSTNGELTLNGSTTYFFECSLNLSSMSGTSGNMGFSIVGAGTATFTSAAWHAFGLDATTQTTAAAAGSSFSASQAATGNIVTAATGTAVSVLIKGVFRINAGGTIIPSVQLTTAAAAAVVGVNSWFKCYPVGTNTVTTVGNWS